MSDPIIVLVRDLMFAGRIGATARAAGANIIMLRDADKLAEADGRRLIVDLNQPGALDAAAQWKNRTGGSVTGFTAHTDSDTIARAKSLGVDRILTRSAFVQQLPELLKNESSDHGDETNP